MKIIFLLSVFLVYLILLLIISTLLEKTIKISTKKDIRFSKLIVPSTLVIITWVSLTFLYILTLTHLKVDLATYIINNFLNLPTPFSNFTLIIGVLGLYILIAIILQSIYVYLINFNLSRPFNIIFIKCKKFIAKSVKNNKKVDNFFKNISSKIFKKDVHTKKITKHADYKIDFLTCIFSSILTFIFIIAFIAVLMLITKLMTNTILSMIIKK